MASDKKINIPISSLSSDEIYALLDSIESDDEEEDIENFKACVRYFLKIHYTSDLIT